MSFDTYFKKQKSAPQGYHPRRHGSDPLKREGSGQFITPLGVVKRDDNLIKIREQLYDYLSSAMIFPSPADILQKLQRLCDVRNVTGDVGEEIAIPDVIQHIRLHWRHLSEEQDMIRTLVTPQYGFHPLLNRHNQVVVLQVSYKNSPMEQARTGFSVLPDVPQQTPRSVQRRARRHIQNVLGENPRLRALVQLDKKPIMVRAKRPRSFTADEMFDRIRQRLRAHNPGVPDPEKQGLLDLVQRYARQLSKTRLTKKRARGTTTPIMQTFFIRPEDRDEFLQKYAIPFGYRYRIEPRFVFSLSAEHKNALVNMERIRKHEPIQAPPGNLILPQDSSHIPFSFVPVHLRPYQVQLAGNRASRVFFHEAGTGKTLTAMATAVDFILQHYGNTGSRVIIIAPKSTVDQVWQNEVQERINPNHNLFAPVPQTTCLLPEIDFVEWLTGDRIQDPVALYHELLEITNTIRSRILIKSHDDIVKVDQLNVILAGCQNDPNMVILDEAHNFKIGPVSSSEVIKRQRTDCILNLHGSFYIYRLLAHPTILQALFLTATPIVNSLEDVNNFIRWCQICNPTDQTLRQALTPLVSAAQDYATNRTQFPCDQKPFPKLNEMYPPLKKPTCTPDLAPLCRPYFSVVKRDTSNYPKAVFKILHCRRFPHDQDANDMAIRFEEEYARRVRSTNPEEKLADEYGGKKKKTRANANVDISAVYKKEIEASLYLETATGDILLSPVLLELISNNTIVLTNQHRTVIYVQNYKSLDLIKRLLKRKFPGLTVREINGKTESSERRLIANEFSTIEPIEGSVLIIMRAATEGVNLKKVTNVVFANEVWTQAMYDQIVGRGVRFRSHVTLPAKKRVVHIFNLYNQLLDPQDPQKAIPTVGPYMRHVRLGKKSLFECFERAVI